MRKFTAFLLMLLSVLGLSACGNADQSDMPVTEIDTQESKPEQEEPLYQQTMTTIILR